MRAHTRSIRRRWVSGGWEQQLKVESTKEGGGKLGDEGMIKCEREIIVDDLRIHPYKYIDAKNIRN